MNVFFSRTKLGSVVHVQYVTEISASTVVPPRMRLEPRLSLVIDPARFRPNSTQTYSSCNSSLCDVTAELTARKQVRKTARIAALLQAASARYARSNIPLKAQADPLSIHTVACNA